MDKAMETQMDTSNNNLSVNNGSGLLEKNKAYWNCTKDLIYREQVLTLNSRDKEWTIVSGVLVNRLDIFVSCKDIVNIHLYDIIAGIIESNHNVITMAKGRKHLTKNNVYEVRRLIGRTELESILQSGKEIFLFVEIKRKNAKDLIVKGAQNNETKYEDYFLSSRNSDMTIAINGKLFSCHKAILAAHAPALLAMLENDTKRKASGIEDIDPDIFQEILCYLYSDDKNRITWTKVIDVFKVANKYGVKNLENLCLRYIKKEIIITEDIFYEIFPLIRLYNISEIHDLTLQYFLKYHQKIIVKEKWKKFCIEYPDDAHELQNRLVEYFTNLSQLACTTRK